MPKVASVKLVNEPLHVQLEKDRQLTKTKKTNGGAGKREKNASLNQQKESSIVDAKTSEKILRMVREQQEDVQNNDNDSDFKLRKGMGVTAAATAAAAAGRSASSAALVDSDDEDEEEEIAMVGGAAEYEDWDGEGYDELDIDQGDRQLLEKFMNGGDTEKKTLNLSQVIMSKIEAANAEATKGRKALELAPGMNPKVIEVYTKVGMLLSRYKSGPLPKTFKIIPTLRDWEEVLQITNPSEWTPQAMYEATRIFTSNLKAKMAQRFFNLILLERVRDDIAETKKLNYHLYMALKKSLYKPAAFFKGFLLPLCESGECTLREAAIIGSVLVKVSVPALHSAAALLKIAEMEYTGPNSLFIRILLDKKYALPYKVIDSLIFHFLSFKQDKREMPVLWHQSLMVFAQRYKEDMTPDQKEALLDLIKAKPHYEISAEIRRELVNSSCRGEMKVDETE